MFPVKKISRIFLLSSLQVFFQHRARDIFVVAKKGDGWLCRERGGYVGRGVA